MWQYIISGVFAVIVTIIEVIATRERKKTQQFTEEIGAIMERRAEESKLSMQMMDATMQLSIVSANALSGGHNNGNVEAAKEAAERAQEEYQNFLRKVASEAMNKPLMH